MNLSLASVFTVLTEYEKEIQAASGSPSSDPFLEKLTLKKIQLDLPRLLHALHEHKSSKSYMDIHKRLLSLSSQVDEKLYFNHKSSLEYASRFAQNQPPPSAAPTPPTPNEAQPQDVNLASLRRRLLAEGTATSFDNGNVSNDQVNDYHESIQDDLLSDLTTLASALKTSAQTLSTKIIDDANLVSETSENMARSSTLMSSVGANLNAYLSEKSGGKISLFFLIKIAVFIFVLFFVMVFLAKIFPKM